VHCHNRFRVKKAPKRPSIRCADRDTTAWPRVPVSSSFPFASVTLARGYTLYSSTLMASRRPFSSWTSRSIRLAHRGRRPEQAAATLDYPQFERLRGPPDGCVAAKMPGTFYRLSANPAAKSASAILPSQPFREISNLRRRRNRAFISRRWDVEPHTRSPSAFPQCVSMCGFRGSYSCEADRAHRKTQFRVLARSPATTARQCPEIASLFMLAPHDPTASGVSRPEYILPLVKCTPNADNAHDTPGPLFCHGFHKPAGRVE